MVTKPWLISDTCVLVIPRRLTTSGIAKSGGDSPRVSFGNKRPQSGKYIEGKSEQPLFCQKSVSASPPCAVTPTPPKAWTPSILIPQEWKILAIDTFSLGLTFAQALIYDIQGYLTLWVPTQRVNPTKPLPPIQDSSSCSSSYLLTHCCPGVTIWAPVCTPWGPALPEQGITCFSEFITHKLFKESHAIHT